MTGLIGNSVMQEKKSTENSISVSKECTYLGHSKLNDGIEVL